MIKHVTTVIFMNTFSPVVGIGSDVAIFVWFSDTAKRTFDKYRLPMLRGSFWRTMPRECLLYAGVTLA
jgi:hypothetical protein